MKRLLFLILCTTAAATSWTEFYVQSTGSNVNAGSTADNAAELTATNGGWDSGTGIFTCAGATDLSGVTAGEWASVYNDGATVAVFVGRITGVNDGADTITVSTTIKAGTAPTTSGTGRSIKVGGAWAGPSGAEDFPFGFAGGTMTNSSGNKPRVNFKGDGDNSTADYTVSASILPSVTGIIQWEGYTTMAGDGGLTNISGPTTGTNFRLLEISGALNSFAHFIFENNGDTGNANTAGDGVFVNIAETSFFRCAFRNFRRAGLRIESRSHAVECEAYNCNTSNTSGGVGGFVLNGNGCHLVRCISHDNTTLNTSGFAGGGFSLINCIADSNGAHGSVGSGAESQTFLRCDFYNNGGDGTRIGIGSGAMIANIQNCNFVNNRGWGINFQGVTMVGTLYGNRFGAGTMDNDLGTFSTQDGLDQIDNSSYASDVTPWVDPANGDFRITLAAAKNAGRGSYTVGGTTTVLGYPDIGAAQHQETSPSARTYKLRAPFP